MIGGVFGIIVALVLIWALYPAMAQLGAVYGLLFLVFAILLVIGAIAGLLRG